ncbi:MAG TPA: ABC transporter ATP-binding protein, partial [Planctomycetaceae bacterium]|nr:ABC transporter ATP-binding protein [Planctomycetaceae bacterium]
MIRCISGLQKPDSGAILRHGLDVGQHGSSVRLGLVPQNMDVYPDLSVKQN